MSTMGDDEVEGLIQRFDGVIDLYRGRDIRGQMAGVSCNLIRVIKDRQSKEVEVSQRI